MPMMLQQRPYKSSACSNLLQKEQLQWLNIKDTIEYHDIILITSLIKRSLIWDPTRQFQWPIPVPSHFHSQSFKGVSIR